MCSNNNKNWSCIYQDKNEQWNKFSSKYEPFSKRIETDAVDRNMNSEMFVKIAHLSIEQIYSSEFSNDRSIFETAKIIFSQKHRNSLFIFVGNKQDLLFAPVRICISSDHLVI